MRLHTIALGCQMSEADSAEMSRPLLARGFKTAETPEDAEAILITTCTVRQHAEDRAVSLIGSLRPWKEENPDRLLIVAGCAAERLKDWIQKRFPHVDMVVGAKSIDQFPDLVSEALRGRFDAVAEDRLAFGEALYPVAEGSPEFARERFVTIMRGCNYSCSYCIVPDVRGRELYRPVEMILSEIKAKTAAGLKEIMLLGQTVNSYSGEYEGQAVRFPELLRLIDQTPGLERVRFMSPHPHYADDKMAQAMADCRTVCESLHLPVQSGSERILKLMRRNYTPSSYLARIEAFRKAVPGIVFSTDVIVGFPTETEEDFEATLSLVKALAPVGAYCFKYSPRPGTESAGLEDDVPEAVKDERLARILELTEDFTQHALKSQIGRTVEVLLEKPGFGRTREGFKVRMDESKTPLEPGRLATAKITAATDRVLLGGTNEK